MNLSQVSQDQMQLYLIKLLKENKRSEFQKVIDKLHPYELGEYYRSFPEKHHHRFILFSTPGQVAILLQELESEFQLKILKLLGVEKASEVMDLMENDDLADLLSELSIDRINEYLSAMKREESQTVKSLLGFAPDTAGGIMTNRYVWIRSYYTVQEAIEKLKNFASYAENIYYLYVIDGNKKLVGVVSYRDLLIAEADETINNIMYSRVISVPIDMDQEQVATIIERYDFIAVPVVDDENRLVGIVTVDDVIDVLITEANEDFDKLAATGKTIDFQTKAWTAAFRRLPWLLLLLLIGLVSGGLIASFESTIQQVVALTFFMPMIAGMTGNTGTQSLAIVIRGLASQDLTARTIVNLIFREFGVSLVVGTICGLSIAVFTYFWQGEPVLSFVVGLSLFLTLIVGTMAGTIIPIILSRLNVDPAIASGPLITTLNDIFSLTIYFGLATIFIHSLL